MRTRNSYFLNNSSVTIPRCRNKRRTPNVVEPELHTIVEIAPMADNRTMKELLQAPMKGYGEAIVISEINADHFEIKTNLLQLVQANPYHGFERENHHTHINNFKRITSTLKFRDVPNDEDLINKFVKQFFPPSKTTHLKNEISCFTQRFEETFGETWERFKEMLRACHHHGFTELPQIDTFYNGVNDNDQDSLNTAAGGNLWSKTTREGLQIIENKSKVRYSRNKQNVSRMNTNFSNQPSVCVATGTYNQVAPQNHASNYMAPPGFALMQNSQNRYNQGQGNNFNRGNNFHGNQPFQVPGQGFQGQPFQVPNNPVQKGFPNEFSSYKKANDQMMRNMQSQTNSLKGEFKNEIHNTIKTQQTVLIEQQNAFQNNLQNMLSGFFQNQSSTSVERETKESTDKEQTNFQGSTAHIRPSVTPIPEPDVSKILTKPNIPYLSRLNDQKLHKKCTNQMEKFFQIFQDLHFDISFADALLLMLKFASTIKSLLMNKDKLFELAKIPLNEDCSAMLLKNLSKKLGDPGKFLIPCDFSRMDVCHALADLGASINLMPLSIWKNLSLTELTPTRMTLELADRSITRPKGVAEDVFIKVGKFHFSIDFVVVDFEADPRVPLILGRSFLRTGRALIDVYGEEINLQEILGFSNNSLGGNPTSTSEPIISDSFSSLTPFEGSDFILEEIEAYLKDESISPKIDHADQRKTKHFQPIHCASKTMTEAQIHYTTTKKEMLVVVYAFEKSRPYLVLSKSIMYTDHSALKYLLGKQVAKPRLIWWVLLLQEFDIIIRDKKGTENLATDHLSRLENPHKDVFENKDINENFPLETLGKISGRTHGLQTL
uniref:Reverse transcriptase domain-containing protein n=1 Tax=Tanacetum cinerariifolium TaxID=118510 RepID=A0A6L2KVK2_TANCI|nr:hypothetical protein [Tanacetum cinerariifolium]